MNKKEIHIHAGADRPFHALLFSNLHIAVCGKDDPPDQQECARIRLQYFADSPGC